MQDVIEVRVQSIAIDNQKHKNVQGVRVPTYGYPSTFPDGRRRSSGGDMITEFLRPLSVGLSLAPLVLSDISAKLWWRVRPERSG